MVGRGGNMRIDTNTLEILVDRLGPVVRDIDVAELMFDQTTVPVPDAVKREIAAMLTTLGYEQTGGRYRVWTLNPAKMRADFDHERRVIDLRERFAKHHTGASR